MARNFGHARAVNIQTWENLKQYGYTKLQDFNWDKSAILTALPLNSSPLNVETFYLILFFRRKT